MADYSLGTAHGTVKIDSDTTGVDQANKSLDTLGAKGKTTGQAVQEIGTKMGIAGAVIAGGLAVATHSAMDFDKELSGIKAVTGASGDQMDQLRAKALQLGADTTFSASEAAGAMSELAKAGVPVEAILGGAADATTALAAATGVDLTTAATAASDAMNMFGLSASDLGGVVDTMAQTANASSIDMSDLQQGLSQVGAVAHLAGMNFDDTAKAIGEMGNAGIKGSDAGTSLKTMLMNLQPQTKQAAAEMQNLGIITKDGTNSFYDQNGKLKGLKDIQQILQDSTKGLTAEQKQQALQTMFGSDAIRAAAVMSDAGAKGYDKFSASMKSSGSAADQAKTRQDNLAGSVEQLKGSLDTLAIGIGEALTPAVRWLADGLTTLTNWFTKLPGPVQSVIAVVLAASAGLLLLGAGFIKVYKIISDSAAAFKTIVTAIKGKIVADEAAAASAEKSALASAAAWAKSAAETVALWAMYAYQAAVNAAKVAAAWVVSTAQSAAAAVASTVTTVAKIVAQWVVMAVQSMINAVKTAAAWAVTTGTAAATAIATTAASVAKMIASWVLLAAQSVLNAGKAAIAWAIANGPAMATAMIEFGIAVATTVAGWIAMAAGAIADAAVIAAGWLIAMGPVGWAIAIVLALLAVIIAFWPQISSAFQTGAAAVWGWMKQLWDWIVQAWNAIKQAFTDAWNWIVGIFQQIGTAIQTAWNAIINAFKTAGEAVWNAMKQTWQWVQDVWNSIINFFRQIPGWITGVFTGALNWLVNAGQSILNGLWNGVKTVWNSVLGWFKSVGGWIIGALGDAGSWLLGVGKAIVEGLWNGIKGAASWLWNQVKSWALGIFDGIKSLFHIGSPSKLFRDEIGYWLAVGLADGITKGTPAATAAAEESAGAVIRTMQRTLADGSTLSATIGSNLTAGQVASLGGGPLIGGQAGTAGSGLNPVTGTGQTNRSAAAFDYTTANGKTVHIEMNTYNPVAEKASDNEARKLRAAAAVGAF